MLVKLKGKSKNRTAALCRVSVEDEIKTFRTFVAVGFEKETNKVTLISNDDPLTAAVALEVVKEHFKNIYNELDDEQKRNVNEYLNVPTQDI